MRAIVVSLVLALIIGPVAQAAGHGACHGDARAVPDQAASEVRAGEMDAAHAHHHDGVPTGDETPPGTTANAKHGKCECGCLCAAGHACSSAAPASIFETAGYALVPVHHSPPSDESGFANFVSGPHTRPPIDTLR